MTRYVFAMILSACCGFGYAAESNYYLVQYRAGANFSQTLGYEKQPGLKSHHAYIRKLHVNDQVVMGGAVSGDLVGVLLIKTSSRDEAEALIRTDPGVISNILVADVLAWDVSLTSMRVMRRKPMAAIEDPDAPFRLQRIDSESAINIEQQ